MKDMCITSFVFGDSYQDYIPLFIFSIQEAYPEYDIFIFIDKTLSPHVLEQVTKLNSRQNVHLIENYTKDIDFKNSLPYGAAVRWLLWDDKFLEYRSIYIADIDIFYCKEEISIFNQHEMHCNYIDLPFSNVARKPKKIKRFNLIEFARNIKRMSFNRAIKCFFLCKGEERRLTGLHFIRTSFQREIIKNHGHYFWDIIKKKTFLPHHSRGFNDESFLYDICKKSKHNYKKIPVSSTNNSMLDSSPANTCFRPHHGIHLGIFRGKSLSHDSIEILNTKAYKMHYNYIKEKDILKKIPKSLSSKPKKELLNLYKFYSSEETSVL